MKRMLPLLLALCMVLLLPACGLQGTEGATPAQNAVIAPVETTDARFAGQTAIDLALAAEYQADYPLDEALIVVDPYGFSPLSAVAFFSTDAETRATVTIKGRDDATTLTHAFSGYSQRHCLPIYGLYGGADNQVTIAVEDKKGKTAEQTFMVTTDTLPADMSIVGLETASPEKMQDGLTFVDFANVNSGYPLAIDANGDVRWYLSDRTFSGGVMMAHLKNGSVIVGSGIYSNEMFANLSRAFEVTPLGRCEMEYNIFGIHHDVREKANGNIIFGASKEGRETVNDYFVEVDRATGEVVAEWDLQSIIPMTEYLPAAPYGGGGWMWLHNNGIWYIEEEDAFIISCRSQNMVLKFDAASGEIKWILSETVGAGNEQLRPYLLTPVGEPFEYPYSQHAAMLGPDGDLYLFDNRNADAVDENGALIPEQLYSRAVRYHVDEENRTVQEVWSFGKQLGGEVYSSFVSDIDYLDEGHYLIDFGGIYQDDAGNNFDLTSDHVLRSQSNHSCCIIELVDDEVVFKVKLNETCYKAERKDLYLGARELQFAASVG